MTNRLLIISLSNIGDVIMTTPVMEALHRRFPAAVIDIVADARSAELFRYCPYRGEVYFKNKKDVFRGAWSLLKDLRKNYYDLIVDLRTDGLAYLLRTKRRLTKWHRIEAGRHSVQQHMAIIGSMFDPKETPSCHIWLSKDEHDFADDILYSHRGKKLLGLGPGANSSKKIWPINYHVSLLEQVYKQFDAVILFGSKNDKKYAEYISARSKLACIDVCGKTSLLQAAALLGRVELYIGNDSGLGHMASAMGRPTITIFGPGEPERYRPWGNKAAWLIGKDQKIENVEVQDVISLISRYKEIIRP